jgi:ornithine cyclodeaminase
MTISSYWMRVLVLDQRDVIRLLPMAECMEEMEGALKALSDGDANMPLRTIVWLPERVGALASMPAALGSGAGGAMGVKAISVFPGNLGTGLDSHQGVVLLFEMERGRLLSISDATAITAIRTAAVSGVATGTLARQDAGDLAILGSGTQARTHLEAMLLARPLRRVRIWSRRGENAALFAQDASARHGLAVEACPSAKDAVAGADLICTVTASVHPVLMGEWLSPGVHVNAVGAVGPVARELDTAAVARSRLFVDRRESAQSEAGEFVQARDEGVIGPEHIQGELGDVLQGKVAGRVSPEEITVFRAVGLAVEDVAAARHVYHRAVEEGAGVWVELGGERDETS